LSLLHRRLRLSRLQENTEGGRAPNQNALRLDFRKQLPPLSIVMTPAMTNVITDADGMRYNIMIAAADQGSQRR
jgi:arsenite oxidase large subunit